MSAKARRFSVLAALGAGLLLGFMAPAWAQESAEPADDSDQPQDVLHAPSVAAAISMMLRGERIDTPTTQSSDPLVAIWQDPTFKKQLIGSYGINADIEPRVNPEEVKLIQDVAKWMPNREDWPTAERALKDGIEVLKKSNKNVKDDDKKYSAILDFNLANVQSQQGHLDEALVTYQLAVKKFPSFRRAYKQIGLIYARKGEGHWDEAIAAFTKFALLGGVDPYAYGLLGHAFAAKKDYQAAEVAFRNALILQPEETEWRKSLVTCVYNERKFEDCAALLNVFLENDPGNVDLWKTQAQAYLGMNQPLKAAENLEIVDRLGKASMEILYLLGDIYQQEKLIDQATGAYQRAIDANTAQTLKNPLLRASVLAAAAPAQAAQLIEHIEKTWPNLDGADKRQLLKIKARVTMAQGNGDDAAAQVLQEIVAIDPLDGEALMMLGQHYARKKEPNRAILYYERAAGLSAFEAPAKIAEAQVLVNLLSRYADALPLLRRAMEIKPRDDVARYMADVERLSKSKAVPRAATQRSETQPAETAAVSENRPAGG